MNTTYTNSPVKPSTVFILFGFIFYLLGVFTLARLISIQIKLDEISFSVFHEQSVILLFILGAILHGFGAIIGAIRKASLPFKHSYEKISTPLDDLALASSGDKDNCYPAVVIIVLILATALIVVISNA